LPESGTCTRHSILHLGRVIPIPRAPQESCEQTTAALATLVRCRRHLATRVCNDARAARPLRSHRYHLSGLRSSRGLDRHRFEPDLGGRAYDGGRRHPKDELLGI
jgi:hypothetical protein